MNIAISNIAWDPEEDDIVAGLLANRSLRGIEVAPTKIWPAPLNTPVESLHHYREFWKSRGVGIVALQALLFGRPELAVFQSEEIRRQTLDYLCGIIRLSSQLGARILVFGSPQNRRIGEVALETAMDIAASFFRQVGECAQKHGAVICIEPNPAAYGCDFVRTAAEGRECVRKVDQSGFRLHLDASAMTLNGEDYERAIEDSFEYLEHFHISEPHLGVIGRGRTDHRRIAACLRRLGYRGWVSVEMRCGWGKPNSAVVATALDFVLDTYHD